MSDYQLHQVCLGVLCVLTSGALTAHAVRVRGTAARVEVVELAAVVGLVAGLSFLLSGYDGGQEGYGWSQAPIDLLKNLPVPFTIAYACSLQARGYKAAWGRRGLRPLLKKAPHVLAGALILSVALPAAWPYAPPEAGARAPSRALIVEWLASGPQLLFASLAALVFFEAARTQAPGRGVRVQNLAAGFAMVLFALEAVIYAAYWAAGTLGTAPLIDLASSVTFALMVPIIALELAALFVAVVAFYGRSDTDRLAEKAVDFFDYVGQISGILANAPVWEKGISAPYAKLVEASGEEFLNLSPSDGRKAADTFRSAAILKRRTALDGTGHAVANAEASLLRLVRMHDEALADPGFSSWLRSVSGRQRDRELCPHSGTGCTHEDAPTLHEPLEPLLRLGGERWQADALSAEPWEQLARLACAEAGFLPRGERAVSERVRNNYELADAKLRFGVAQGG